MKQLRAWTWRWWRIGWAHGPWRRVPGWLHVYGRLWVLVKRREWERTGMKG